MKLFKQINEAVELADLQSNWLKSPKSTDAAKAVANGEDSVKLSNGKTYRATKRLTGKDIQKGQVVLARYNTYNQGVDICKILGVTGDEEKYGAGGIKFASVKDALRHYNVKTLPQLEALQDQNEYGYHSYLYVEDMEDVESAKAKRGPWYYIDEGRWCRGSGAEKLSFMLMEEVEEDDADDGQGGSDASGFDNGSE